MHNTTLLMTAILLGLAPFTFAASAGSDDFDRSLTLAQSDINLEMQAVRSETRSQQPAESEAPVSPMATLVFDCKLNVVSGASFQESSFRLILSGDTAVIKEKSGEEHTGKLDTDYRPRSNKDMVRFLGSNVGLLLVQKDMLAGRSGAIKIQERTGADYFNQLGRCEALPTAVPQ